MTTLWHVFCVLSAVVALVRHYLPPDLAQRFDEAADRALDAEIEKAKQAFTAPTGQDAIAQAIRDRELEVVPGLIQLLALQDPTAAQAVLDTVELARTMATAQEVSDVPR